MADDQQYDSPGYNERAGRNEDVQEVSKTGDIDVEVGNRRQFFESPVSSPFRVASPDVSSRNTVSTARKRRRAWERDLGMDLPSEFDDMDEEQRKFWAYQHIYGIPVPSGIENWDEEEKQRWEMIHIGGMSESEADRQIKKMRIRDYKERRRARWELRDPEREDATFLASLICFGFQLIIAIICFGFCIHQFVADKSQVAIALAILACVPLLGAIGGIFCVLMRSQSLGVLTAIYNLATGFGVVIVATTMYTSRKFDEFPRTFVVPIAAIIAVIQIVSFGMVLVIHRCFLSTAAEYPRTRWRRGWEDEDYSPDEENEYRGRRRRRMRRKMEKRARLRHRMKKETEAVTKKYKRYLRKMRSSKEKSGQKTPRRKYSNNNKTDEESIRSNEERRRGGSDTRKRPGMARIHKKVKHCFELENDDGGWRKSNKRLACAGTATTKI